MFKKFLIIVITMVVIGLIALSTSSQQKAYADAKDNLTKSSVGIVGGWSETLIYPVQEASKPGLWGKALFPINIGVGAIKGAFREAGGAIDFVTFWKGKNVVDSYPGEEL